MNCSIIDNNFKSIDALYSLERLSLCTSFPVANKIAIVDDLRDRAIKQITLFQYIFDAIAGFVCCGHYETTLQKIDRLYKAAMNIPLAEVKAASPKKIESPETPPPSQDIPDEVFKILKKPLVKVEPLKVDAMADLKTELRVPAKLDVIFSTHFLAENADPLAPIDSKQIMRILGDSLYLTSEFLDRNNLLETLEKIQARLKGRHGYAELSKYLEKKILKIEAIQVAVLISTLKKFDPADPKGLSFVLYCNSKLIKKQTNSELYKVLYETNERVKNIPGEGDQRKWCIENLVEHSDSVRKDDLASSVPRDVWLYIFKQFDKDLYLRKYSNWFTMLLVSKRMRGHMQAHINAQICSRNLYLEKASAKEAIAYTIKNNIPSIALWHNNVTVNDLEALYEGAPNISKIGLSNVTNEMLPVLYKFKELRSLVLQRRSGSLQELDLTSFGKLEYLELNYVNAKGIKFRDNDQTLKKIEIAGHDSHIQFNTLKGLETLVIESSHYMDKIELCSPNLSRFSLKYSQAKAVIFDRCNLSLTTLEIINTSLESVSLPSEVPELSSVVFSKVRDLKGLEFPIQADSLENINITECPGIETLKLPLSLSKCKKVEIDRTLIRVLEFPSQMPALKMLSLKWMPVQKVVLPLNMPMVESIKVHSCKELTDLNRPANVNEGVLELFFNDRLT